MVVHRQHVILLATVGTMPVTDETEILEHIQGPVHRRGDRRRIACAAAFHQVSAGDVTVSLRQHLDHRATLGGPAQAARAKPFIHARPRRRQPLEVRHGCSLLPRWPYCNILQ
jgi:hypothetical protein